MDPTYKGLSVPTPGRGTTSGLNLKKGLFVGVGLIVAIVLVSFIVNLFSGNNVSSSQRLLYRLDALASLVKNASPSIKDEQLGKVNTDLSLVLTGDVAAIKKLIPVAKTTKELTAAKNEETDAATTAKLKDALINGRYDPAYRAVLREKLQNTYTLAKQVASASSNTALKTSLQTLCDHVTTYYNQLK